MKQLFLLLSAALFLLAATPQQGLAIDYEWITQQGKSASLTDYRGKPLILHFWASWCPPCREEMPELSSWVKAHPEFTLVAVSLDEDMQEIEKFLETNNISLPALQGNKNEVVRLGIRGLPATLLIDAKGEILRQRIGAVPWKDPAASANFLQHLQ